MNNKQKPPADLNSGLHDSLPTESSGLYSIKSIDIYNFKNRYGKWPSFDVMS